MTPTEADFERALRILGGPATPSIVAAHIAAVRAEQRERDARIAEREAQASGYLDPADHIARMIREAK